MTVPAPDTTLVLAARGISKVYSGTTALAGVDFDVRAGQVQALIGENGAGKSTLMKILCGIEEPTSGTLVLNGKNLRFTSITDAAQYGIAIVHQELQLFPNLSVAENLFVGRELRTRWGSVDSGAQNRAASAALQQLGQSLDPGVLVESLPLGLQQIVEIAKALLQQTQVLLMDEPTSAMTPSEVAVLFRIIRGLAAGGVGIVYISHRLEELLEISDSVTVLRDGRLVGHALSADVDVRWIVETMTGRTSAGRAGEAGSEPGQPVLSVQDLCLAATPGRTALDHVSFELRRGEVIGVYGLMGSGRTELFESLLGVHPDATGRVLLDGRAVHGVGVAARVSGGMAMVPEDRKTAGVFPTLDVLDNMTLSSLSRFTRGGWFSPASSRAAAERFVSDLRIKTSSLTTPVLGLSGGNQQKVVIARAVMSAPRVLLLDEPTRGVDVGAKAEILETARRLARGGMGVMFASSDLGEIFAAADRVLVMSRGRITAECPVSEATEHGLAAAASRTEDASAGAIDAGA